MCRSLDAVREIAEVGGEEERLLRSASAPVVLLRKRRDPVRAISQDVAPRNAYLGIMLPHAPVHHLLFDDDLSVLVMTSGNASGEPIVAEPGEARGKLAGVADAFLAHDRGIVNRNDDSIACVESGRTVMVRRSRGFAPYPVDLECGVEGAPDVLACGTELKCTFTVLEAGRAYVSQHLGDMENQATLEFYEEAVERFVAWFRARPEVVAHDLHPDYLATRFAKAYAARQGVATEGIQHHHAHIASVMAENGIAEPVVGLALDGTGYGTDGNIWGCEFLVADLAGFERAGHLANVPLPGGDAAVRRPYRVALSHLYAAGGDPLVEESLRLFDGIPPTEIDLVRQQVAKRVNCVDTSSAGRLFDAVSALLGVCRDVTYDAQAAIELESLVDAGVSRAYPYDVRADGVALVIDPAPIVRAVAADAAAGVAAGECAAAFHNAVVSFSREAAVRIARERGLSHGRPLGRRVSEQASSPEPRPGSRVGRPECAPEQERARERRRRVARAGGGRGVAADPRGCVMCLAIPGRIVSIDGNTAQLDYNGVTGEADISLVPGVVVGDYVLVHAGFAIEEIETEDARGDRPHPRGDLRRPGGRRVTKGSPVSLDALRSEDAARPLVRRIHALTDRPTSLMEVCGTHTVAISRWGLRSLMPPDLKLLSGPGLPRVRDARLRDRPGRRGRPHARRHCRDVRRHDARPRLGLFPR